MMSLKLNYGGLSGGTTFTFPDNFYLAGLGTLETNDRFIKKPAAHGGFNAADKTLKNRTLSVHALHTASDYTRESNLDYYSALITWLEQCRIRTGELRFYHRDDRFFWVDSYKLRHALVEGFGGAISNYQIDLDLTDPLTYLETETTDTEEITDAESSPHSWSLSGFQSEAKVIPVIKIIPANGVSATNIQFTYSTYLSTTGGSFNYNNPALSGDASGETWIEINCVEQTVIYTTDDGDTIYNDIGNFSGTFPFIIESGLTCNFGYQGGDADITVTARKAYFA